jgi:hypothetical protein
MAQRRRDVDMIGGSEENAGSSPDAELATYALVQPPADDTGLLPGVVIVQTRGTLSAPEPDPEE